MCLFRVLTHVSPRISCVLYVLSELWIQVDPNAFILVENSILFDTYFLYTLQNAIGSFRSVR